MGRKCEVGYVAVGSGISRCPISSADFQHEADSSFVPILLESNKPSSLLLFCFYSKARVGYKLIGSRRCPGGSA